MSDPYLGFEPLTYEAAQQLKGDIEAGHTLVRIAEQFMKEEAPLMAVAAGIIPNVHRTVDRETAEEGMGRLAHRILVSRKLKTSFVIIPATLNPSDAEDFVKLVVPQYEHLVVAAQSYEPGFRSALQRNWPGTLSLLLLAGTERQHEYHVYEGD